MPDDTSSQDDPQPQHDDITPPEPEAAAPEPPVGESTQADPGPSDEDAPEGETTPGGYSYTVVEGDDAAAAATGAKPARSGGINPIWLAVAAIVPAVIVGAAVWFFGPGGGGGDDRTQADVSNVVAAFSTNNGSVVTRYEGEVPPGLPDTPLYPGAETVSSVLQVTGEDASYLVVYDTSDSREEVSQYYANALAKDPWQIDAGSDNRDATFHQFSRIDDPDVVGIVLIGSSKDDGLTTIVHSIQVTSGAPTASATPFATGDAEARALPEGFPDKVPVYDGGFLIEAAYQKQAGASQFAISFVTKSSITDVLDYYREQLPAGGLTVEDGDPSGATLEDAEVIQFADADANLRGVITAGKFGEDGSYTQVDIQTQEGSASSAQ